MRSLFFATACVIAVTASAPANALRIQIDGSYSPISVCSIGSPCTAQAMPFSANFGTGSFNALYVYDNGLVSIGSEIAAGADLSSLASIGGNVFTAGYSPGGLMPLSNFEVQDTFVAFDATGRLLAKPVFRIRYSANVNGTAVPMQFSVFDVGAGEYALQLTHGSVSTFDIAADAYLGYSFGGSGIQRSGPSLVNDVRAANVDFEYFFGGRGGAVPEPSTWATMLIGFGLIGSQIRKRSKKLQTT